MSMGMCSEDVKMVVLSEMIEVFDVLSCFVVMFDLVEFN